MQDIRRGLIIVNTGPGKGKTTAAMGTALRAVGQGMRVLMLQFLKGSWHYGELDAVQAFGDKFVMKQMGRGFVKVGAEKPDPEDVRMVEEAWAEAVQAIQSGTWDLVILDEINYAISYGMLDPAKVVETLKSKPEMVHIILTGRNAHPTIVEARRHGHRNAPGKACLRKRRDGAERDRVLKCGRWPLVVGSISGVRKAAGQGPLTNDQRPTDQRLTYGLVQATSR